MSIREADPLATVPEGVLGGRDVVISRHTTVRRFLPDRARRMIGAWCFVDLFGPDDLATGRGMWVPPHPHTGLQTVTWLFAGDVLHRDSVGSHAAIRPGQLNIMTSGHGIAHSEESVPGAPILHGLQLWIALPAAARDMAPEFAQHAHLPEFGGDGSRVVVVVGELGGRRSPAVVHTPLVGAVVELAPDGEVVLDVSTGFEHGVLAVDGAVTVTSATGVVTLAAGLVYLRPGSASLRLVAGESGARLLLLGGEPFSDPLVMWWNFVGVDHQSIVTARNDWAAGRRFGRVAGDSAPMPAPEMPTVTLLARHADGSRS